MEILNKVMAFRLNCFICFSLLFFLPGMSFADVVLGNSSVGYPGSIQTNLFIKINTTNGISNSYSLKSLSIGLSDFGTYNVSLLNSSSQVINNINGSVIVNTLQPIVFTGNLTNSFGKTEAWLKFELGAPQSITLTTSNGYDLGESQGVTGNLTTGINSTNLTDSPYAATLIIAVPDAPQSLTSILIFLIILASRFAKKII